MRMGVQKKYGGKYEDGDGGTKKELASDQIICLMFEAFCEVSGGLPWMTLTFLPFVFLDPSPPYKGKCRIEGLVCRHLDFLFHQIILDPICKWQHCVSNF